jgi:membrane protease subunit HflC
VVELTSDARRQADVVRGEADAERNRILAEAFGRDTEFFGFIRSLQAYEASLKGSNSSIVMQPDSEFFSYLRGAGVDGIATAPAEPAEGAEAAAEPAEEVTPEQAAAPASP